MLSRPCTHKAAQPDLRTKARTSDNMSSRRVIAVLSYLSERVLPMSPVYTPPWGGCLGWGKQGFYDFVKAV
jgi:hypothetical protein